MVCDCLMGHTGILVPPLHRRRSFPFSVSIFSLVFFIALHVSILINSFLGVEGFVERRPSRGKEGREGVVAGVLGSLSKPRHRSSLL